MANIAGALKGRERCLMPWLSMEKLLKHHGRRAAALRADVRLLRIVLIDDLHRQPGEFAPDMRNCFELALDPVFCRAVACCTPRPTTSANTVMLAKTPVIVITYVPLPTRAPGCERSSDDLSPRQATCWSGRERSNLDQNFVVDPYDMARFCSVAQRRRNVCKFNNVAFRADRPSSQIAQPVATKRTNLQGSLAAYRERGI
jgi:hypothetical protein